MESPFIDLEKSILQLLEIPALQERGIRLLVKRDDLLHQEVSGNKWRKLKYNLEQAKHAKSQGIFTFGGAYSNHLLATAFAAQAVGLAAIGYVRGDELHAGSNETLRRCAELGMDLQFLSREMYAMHSDKAFIDELKLENPGFYAIPEGGGNYYGLVGCQEIWRELPAGIDHFFVAQGTATTSCGILLGKPAETTLHVVPVLKGFDSEATMQRQLQWFLFDEVLAAELVEEVVVHSDYHFGGYAQQTPELVAFIANIQEQYDLPLDAVYTGKAFYALLQTIMAPEFDGKTIVFLHTGGLR
jgi:1-aminocyclopropane-1-carboxylate deaminase